MTDIVWPVEGNDDPAVKQQRKAYTPPQLTEYGHVVDITRGDIGDSADGMGFQVG